MAELDQTNKDEVVDEPTIEEVEEPTEQQNIHELEIAEAEKSEDEMAASTESDKEAESNGLGTISRPDKFAKLKAVLKSKKFYIPTVVIIVAALLFVSLTDIKYSLLGVFIKRDITLEIVDDKTLQPVSGVTVKLDGKSAVTDGKGLASISQVATGNSKLELSKSGYESKTEDVFVRFATTKVEPIRIKGNGYALSFVIKDYVSGVPIKNAKLTLGKIESFTNDKGEALVRALPTGGAKLSLSVTKDGFNTTTQDVEIKDKTPTKEMTLTPAGTAIYVSNKAKKYDVYASDFDGKNERVILAATGKEDASTVVHPSPSGDYVALVASRDGVKANYGSLQHELYVIAVASGELKKVEVEPGQINWSGNTLITSTTVYENDTYKSKLISYNADTKAKKELIGDNVGNVVVAEGKIYISFGDTEKPDYGLYVMGIDGGGKKKLDGKPYNIFRKSVTTLGLTDPETSDMAILNLKDNSIQKTQEQSRAQAADGLTIVTSKDGNTKLFTRTIDSYPQLFSAAADGSKEKQLTKGANVSGGFYVTANGAYAVFYGAVGTEAGVYILPISGGSPLKIANGHVPVNVMYGGVS